jgi:hypothetical protein
VGRFFGAVATRLRRVNNRDAEAPVATVAWKPTRDSVQRDLKDLAVFKSELDRWRHIIGEASRELLASPPGEQSNAQRAALREATRAWHEVGKIERCIKDIVRPAVDEGRHSPGVVADEQFLDIRVWVEHYLDYVDGAAHELRINADVLTSHYTAWQLTPPPGHVGLPPRQPSPRGVITDPERWAGGRLAIETAI